LAQRETGGDVPGILREQARQTIDGQSRIAHPGSRASRYRESASSFTPSFGSIALRLNGPDEDET
jgi:hypothetical protein